MSVSSVLLLVVLAFPVFATPLADVVEIDPLPAVEYHVQMPFVWTNYDHHERHWGVGLGRDPFARSESDPSDIPEPAAFTLCALGFGLAGLVRLRVGRKA